MPKWLNEYRESAWDNLKDCGFPSTRNEEWKYTSVRGVLAEGTLAPCPVAGKTPLPDDLESWLKHDGPLIVFVDGFWSSEHSRFGKSGHGIEILELSSAIAKYPQDVISMIQKTETECTKLPKPVALLGSEADAFKYLANALLREGAFVRVRKNTAGAQSILILHVESGASSTIASPRTLIHLEENSSIAVSEAWIGPNNSSLKSGPASLALPVTEVHLDAGAQLTHTQIHNEGPQSSQIGATYATLERNAQYRSFVFTAGGKLCRKNLTTMINGEGAEVIMDGLYITSAGQHMDHHTVVDHRVPNTTSNQLYKGVLLDKARAVFNGKVFVRRDAQHTAAFQTNKNLLLGMDAEIDTKPQLEIDANDVKCSHGATVSRLNNDEIFYLQSRGIAKKESEDMLCLAFANDVLERIQDKSVLKATSNILKEFFNRNKA